jgi:hypothetical protein
MLRRTLGLCAVALIAATQCGDAGARAGRGSGHVGHSGGGFAAPRGFVSRTVFFAGPVAYFPPAYYYASSYYYPPSYYEPGQPPVYYQPPVQSALPPGGFYPPPPSSGSAPASPRGPYAAQDASRYRFYCPDTRKYYPSVKTCASAWLKVVPDGVAAPR